jgi:hypothetical protein
MTMRRFRWILAVTAIAVEVGLFAGWRLRLRRSARARTPLPRDPVDLGAGRRRDD